MLQRNDTEKSSTRITIEAVAIGTSAGGIEALSFLLPHIPAGSARAFFIVQHILADSDSTFIRLMKEKCLIKVREACNTDEIMPGSVYFAPPDYHLMVEKNLTLSVVMEEKINYSRPSIDVLFETAAEVFLDKLTGILLTGVNRDGSAGLKRIRDLGGRTIVQSPQDATFPDMPLSALRLFQPDAVMTLAEIAKLISNP